MTVLGTKYCRAGQLLILIKSIIVFYIQKMTKMSCKKLSIKEFLTPEKGLVSYYEAQ